MAVPLSGIRDPRWTKPALVLGGSTLSVVSDDATGTDAVVLLERDGDEIPLAVTGTTRQGRRGAPHPPIPPSPHPFSTRRYVRRTCAVPEETRERLYDLTIIGRGRRWTSPNSVYVLSRFRDRLTFLHATDLHLLVGGADGGLVDRSDHAEMQVSRINEIRPDLVLYTGDLISRYGSHQAILPADTIRWQARRVQEIMLDLEVPLFVTVGNHDVAFESSRRTWRTYMGGPWCRPTDDYSFDYGGCHFAAADCFAHYDETTHRAQAMSFTEEQLRWLERDLRAATSSRRRFLFFHYDYQDQLGALIEEFAVDMVLYGHSKKIGLDLIGADDARNGHLSSRQYRLVRVSRETISSTVEDW